MDTKAVVLQGPGDLSLQTVPLVPSGKDEVLVDIHHSGISTGTEKLLWTGEMPPFPGMGYPLIPGYEAMGEVAEAPAGSGFRAGDTVFVPGASCFGEFRGLFGGAASSVATSADRLVRLQSGTGAEGALLALAATAQHALAGGKLPDLIVGHGVLGRLLARLTVLHGGRPIVWETDTQRREGNHAYDVLDPALDAPRDHRSLRSYDCIFDATGDASLLDTLLRHITKGGEIVLAGFYPGSVSFAFPMAFMKEARLRVAAEWSREDMDATVALVNDGRLQLDDLITHRVPAADAETAYPQAFSDKSCLKMILDWRGTA
ncbi:MAG: chlorophyll synthesis pathway protein BchC [Pseudomonadota bacterium]